MLTPQANNWFELQDAEPLNPLDFIANATMVGVPLVFGHSSNFGTGPWGAVTAMAGAPFCRATQSDNIQKVAEAAQWNFNNKSSNLSTALVPELRQLFYVRGNEDSISPAWITDVPIDLGSATYTSIQISDLTNAANEFIQVTKVPVFQAIGAFTGVKTLSLVFKGFGNRMLGIRLETSSTVEMLVMNLMITQGSNTQFVNNQTMNLNARILSGNTPSSSDEPQPLLTGFLCAVVRTILTHPTPVGNTSTIDCARRSTALCQMATGLTTQPGCEDGQHGC